MFHNLINFRYRELTIYILFRITYLVFSYNSQLSVASGPSITNSPQKTPFTLAGVPAVFT